MANEIRVRSNFQSGTITDNPLTNAATTINSAAFASLPAIGATQHLMIILDPTGSAGAPEIVMVIAHTASATSVTVARGQEGSSARQHASGTTWRHGALVSDYDSVLGYAQVTANQGSITTAADLTSLSVAVTVPYAGHRVRITAECLMQSTAADDTMQLTIMEGATQLQQINVVARPANLTATMVGHAIIVPTAASHTYKLQGSRAAGSGTVTMVAGATFPAFILVEDLGPAA